MKRVQTQYSLTLTFIFINHASWCCTESSFRTSL